MTDAFPSEIISSKQPTPTHVPVVFDQNLVTINITTANKLIKTAHSSTACLSNSKIYSILIL